VNDVHDTSKATQSREATTVEKFISSQMTKAGIDISHTKTGLKSGNDTYTTHGSISNQEPQVTGDYSTSDPSVTNSEEQGLKKAFNKPGATSRVVENIFSNEYKEKREAELFKFCNVFFSSNMLVNLLFRTHSFYTRPVRCFFMFSYVYIT
jgi:hypothetical protein